MVYKKKNKNITSVYKQNIKYLVITINAVVLNFLICAIFIYGNPMLQYSTIRLCKNFRRIKFIVINLRKKNLNSIQSTYYNTKTIFFLRNIKYSLLFFYFEFYITCTRQ